MKDIFIDKSPLHTQNKKLISIYNLLVFTLMTILWYIA